MYSLTSSSLRSKKEMLLPGREQGERTLRASRRRLEERLQEGEKGRPLVLGSLHHAAWGGEVGGRDAQTYNCRLCCLLFLDAVETVSRRQEGCRRANSGGCHSYMSIPVGSEHPYHGDQWGCCHQSLHFSHIHPTSLPQSQRQLLHPFHNPLLGPDPCQSLEKQFRP